jgi:hypothetical protein
VGHVLFGTDVENEENGARYYYKYNNLKLSSMAENFIMGTSEYPETESPKVVMCCAF